METETIAEALGHSIATVTDIYIKFNRRKTKPPKKDAQPRQYHKPTKSDGGSGTPINKNVCISH